MNTTTMTATLQAAAALRASATKKLAEAQALIDSAADDLCNLEGRGYCDAYEKTRRLQHEVSIHSFYIRRLLPPTNLFVV